MNAPEAEGQHGQWAQSSHCRVAAVRHYGAFAALELIAPLVARRAAPGQFIMVTVPGGGFLLRRPISIFSARGDRIGIIVEARGPGSERLTRLDVGENVDVAGPLGSAFPLPAGSEAVLVGGGIGCAPLQSVADAVAAAGTAVKAVFGFRDLRASRVAAAFAIERLSVATEDGSVGRTGTVLDLLDDLDVARDATLYVCGPPAMLAAVRSWALARGLSGYASLEAHMACGTGSCHGCVVDTARGRLRVCSEGPVFRLDEVFP